VTRVLYWNIERFSARKINIASPTALLAMQATSRLALIEEMAAGPWAGGEEEEMAVQQPPDIIVVVEVSARTDPVIPEGITLFSGSPGGQGVRQLLAKLRENLGAQWSLVPPLFLGGGGFREGMAVFYNSENVEFAGPWVWSNPAGQVLPSALPPSEASVEAIQNYGVNWAAGFPPDPEGNRTWHFEFEEGGMGANIPESQSAGQWQFFHEGNRIYFPGWENRSPFYTRFWDYGEERWVKLFSVHTSPATAGQAVQRLSLIEELTPGANEVSLIVGDFNVDTFGANAERYNALLERNFRLLLDPRAPEEEASNLNRKPYCMTHILPIAHARPWNAVGGPNTTHNVYPRFGYMGSVLPGGELSEAGAIDNALVRYGYEGGAARASVVNPVIGIPYNQLEEPPAGVTEELTNGATYARQMANEIPLPEGVEEPGDIEGEFLGWENYAKIRSTSDHLPVFVEV
jgi:hypothetical protein